MAPPIDSKLIPYLTTPRHAIIATNRANAAPQLSPVWYLYQDGRFYISVERGTAKFRNLQKDPQVSLCIDSGYPDNQSVVIYGTARLVTSEDPLQPQMRRQIIRPYHPSDESAQQHIDSTAHPEEMALIIVSPTRVLSWGFK